MQSNTMQWIEQNSGAEMPDGPVPGNAQSGVCGASSCEPHALERAVQRELLTMPDVTFTSLQVHHYEGGICLTGVVHVPDRVASPSIERTVQLATGIDQIVNRLVVKTRELA